MSSLNSTASQIRALSLKAIYAARSGHPGGSLSIAELLAVLYFDEMSVDPNKPNLNSRDRLILSKGHACPSLYAALALKGYFPIDEVLTLRKMDGRIEGHPDRAVPGIDAPSGSLGMGLSQGLGMAIGARYQALGFRTYVILGDGDLQEGNTWEAAASASHHKLDNLVAIHDANKLQGDAPVEAQSSLGNTAIKMRAFGWHTIEVNGHDLAAIQAAFKEARATKGRPTFILANTIKGKGVDFMEGQLYWHGSVAMKDTELEAALAQLGDSF